MSNELVTREAQHVSFIEQNLTLIGNQNSLSGDDLKNFAIQCKRTGLDPITRQIYAIPNNGKLTIMASIDGLRLIAERSGAYEGQTAPQWCGDDGVWKDVWLSKETPKACRIGVYKTKFREALFTIALFDEYAGKYAYDDNKGKYKKGDLTFMWAKMPALMIAKVAEALALRKAFPNEMSGIYSTEEMEQAQEPKDITPINTQNALQGAKTEAATAQASEVSGQYVMKCGNQNVKGKKLIDISNSDLSNSIQYFRKDGKVLTGAVKESIEMAEAYLTRIKTKAEPKLDESEVIPF